MTNIAKCLIAALGAAGVTANAVTAAHGWSHVDWVPICVAWSAAAAVYAYPNVATPPKAAPGP